MQVKLARHIGFCFGVERAVKIAEEILRRKKNVYTLGQIIHNPQTVSQLEKKGLNVIKDLNSIKSGTLLICSHGIAPDILKKAKDKGLNIVDATCPYVKKVQNVLRSLKEQGYFVVIVGDKNHPEVKALKGIIRDNALIVENEQDVLKLKPQYKKVALIAQTTQRQDKYYNIAEKMLKTCFKQDLKADSKINLSELRLFDTICTTTLKRQQAAKSLAQDVEVMLVVGGRASANTTRLAQICRLTGVPTYHIEGIKDLNLKRLKGIKKAGLTSGTSTPQQVIKEVATKLDKI